MIEIFLYFCFSLLIDKDIVNFGIKGFLLLTLGAVLLSAALYCVEKTFSSEATVSYVASFLVGLASTSLMANYRCYMRGRFKKER